MRHLFPWNAASKFAPLAIVGLLSSEGLLGCGKAVSPCSCDTSDPVLLSGSGDALTFDGGSEYGLDLGVVAVGSLAVETLQFGNDGGTPYNVLTFKPPSDAEFSIWGLDVPAVVVPGKPVSFAIAFQPQSAGRKTFVVQFATDSVRVETFTINLTGTGIGDGG